MMLSGYFSPSRWPACVAPLILVHDVDDCTHVINVFHEVDIATAAEFEAELAKPTEHGPVVIDFSQCRYIDTSAINPLLRAYERFGDRLQIVVAAKSQVERLFRLLHLQSVLPIVSSIEEAFLRLAPAAIA